MDSSAVHKRQPPLVGWFKCKSHTMLFLYVAFSLILQSKQIDWVSDLTTNEIKNLVGTDHQNRFVLILWVERKKFIISTKARTMYEKQILGYCHNRQHEKNVNIFIPFRFFPPCLSPNLTKDNDLLFCGET